jgi:hypothetical protein
VFVNVADQNAPQLSVIGGGTSGSISEDADSGELVRRSSSFGTNNFIQLQITDNDYVSIYFMHTVFNILQDALF